ncbi:MAG: hypothetical protein LBB95_01560 [Mycoplasmataceae bacterium]|jgi:F0F1-type ATP synthase epsilon subunit|nr:hypothetical protein [Mycoplasmataceae bacterium]
MQKLFNINIITPTGVQFHGNAHSASLHTHSGAITLLADHEKIISVFNPTNINVITDDAKKTFAIGKGVLKFSGNQLSILTDFFVQSYAAPAALRKNEINKVLKLNMIEVNYDNIDIKLQEEISKLKD